MLGPSLVHAIMSVRAARFFRGKTPSQKVTPGVHCQRRRNAAPNTLYQSSRVDGGYYDDVFCGISFSLNGRGTTNTIKQAHHTPQRLLRGGGEWEVASCGRGERKEQLFTRTCTAPCLYLISYCCGIIQVSSRMHAFGKSLHVLIYIYNSRFPKVHAVQLL